ncbi:MAG TPA: HPr family phosphocarrier protein [Candidatus Gallacutalibacter pullicola]|uniref:Phosphocarrier protein HPr n=1 Tax=Candidatus Gallacutalibacter pullicola TaxID=2840830 RepID=A0A9D1DPG3_9FIRM|nr:HPr family phosphocarrier protein [Candidatus Gallacutalibacter pullicola]
MKEFTYQIREQNGIHARPAAQLVKEAQKFSSDLTVEKDGRSANLKKLFALMALNVRCGDKVVLSVSGPDEQNAMQSLKTFFQEYL